jgi:hypothetical protein
VNTSWLVKSRRERNVQNRVVAGKQSRGSSFQAQTQRVLLWRLADHPREGAVKMERRPARTRRERIKRHVRVEATTNCTEQLEQVSIGRHQQSEMLDEIQGDGS